MSDHCHFGKYCPIQSSMKVDCYEDLMVILCSKYSFVAFGLSSLVCCKNDRKCALLYIYIEFLHFYHLSNIISLQCVFIQTFHFTFICIFFFSLQKISENRLSGSTCLLLLFDILALTKTLAIF